MWELEKFVKFKFTHVDAFPLLIIWYKCSKVNKKVGPRSPEAPARSTDDPPARPPQHRSTLWQDNTRDWDLFGNSRFVLRISSLIRHLLSFIPHPCTLLTTRCVMPTPIVLADLGVPRGQARVSAWFVEPGESVQADERLVEVLIPGGTFDVSAPVSGTLSDVVKPLDAVVGTGDTLGWIEPDECNDEDVGEDGR